MKTTAKKTTVQPRSIRTGPLLQRFLPLIFLWAVLASGIAISGNDLKPTHPPSNEGSPGSQAIPAGKKLPPMQRVSPDGKRRALRGDSETDPVARYIGQWRARVEAAERRYNEGLPAVSGLDGSVLVYAEVRSDGTVGRVRVVRSSGQDLFDRATIRIIQSAAPFPPFPRVVKEEIFDITRTMFFVNGQFGRR